MPHSASLELQQEMLMTMTPQKDQPYSGASLTNGDTGGEDPNSRKRSASTLSEEGVISSRPNKRDMTEEEKLEMRRAANRRSALESRNRRKRLIEELKKAVAELSSETAALKKENMRIRLQLEAALAENRQLRFSAVVLQQNPQQQLGALNMQVAATAAPLIGPNGVMPAGLINPALMAALPPGAVTGGLVAQGLPTAEGLAAAARSTTSIAAAVQQKDGAQPKGRGQQPSEGNTGTDDDPSSSAQSGAGSENHYE